MTQSLSPEFLALQQVVAGRYALERELGRGGMGVVFLARDVALDRLVAIKLLPPGLATRPGLKERFLREARTAAKLSHPNVVAIHSVEEAGDQVFFVMAFVEGETLGERLRARGPLTPHEAARMLQEVAWALGYAHGRGFVHRDVKPDNIMLERASGRAVVMDFGIAAAIDDDAEAFGTAQYVSPEQASGDPIDGRSDLYSLGIATFLALTGQLPFDAQDAHGYLAMHIARPAPPVLSVAPGLPRKLAQAVDRCLAKKPEDRFPDGEALADAVAQNAEPRRQLPVPVRLWLLKGEEERTAWAIMWFGVLGTPAAFGVGALVAMLLHAETLAPWAGLATYVVTPFVSYTANRLLRFRKLLAEGYSIEDAKLALQDYVERRREEVSYEYGKTPPLWARIDRILMIASGSAVFALTTIGFVTYERGPLLAALGAAAVWLGTSVLQTFQPGRPITKDEVAEQRLKFWNSKLGRLFDKLARIGLKKRAVPAELTYRPTEMAISLAADALFESLPKNVRKELKDLPHVMDRLQHDAALMRRTVDELNGALAGIGDHGDAARSSALAGSTAGASLTDTRDKLRADLAAKRDEAAKRLADAVASLETVRLSLLKLKAGTGSVGELTADLSAARLLTSAIDYAVQGRAEVEKLLAPTRTPSGPLQPHGA